MKWPSSEAAGGSMTAARFAWSVAVSSLQYFAVNPTNKYRPNVS
jgi:hypothetical protein